MKTLKQLNDHKFFKKILEDGEETLSHIKFSPSAIEIPPEVSLDEYQYYIQNVGFYVVHTLTWCKQLDLAIELLSNYDYSKKISTTRADHSIYNLENYFIRLNSVYDRVLQIVNAVFHLCADEKDVTHTVIINNYKVRHRPNVHSSIKAIRKFLEKYSQVRNTIIHKHSWQDEKLRKIELFYLHDFDDLPKNDTWKNRLKTFRANYLRKYLLEKKAEFLQINNQLADLLDKLFTQLAEEYERQKKKLK